MTKIKKISNKTTAFAGIFTFMNFLQSLGVIIL